MPASELRYLTFSRLDTGACFEFDPDYAGTRWPDVYKKTGPRTFRDVDTGKKGALRRPGGEPVEERTCPMLAGRRSRRRR
jgi:hypothetical protein